MDTVSERAKARLLEEMARKGLTQRDVAQLLGWSQSKIQKVLTGPVELTVEALEQLAFAVGVSPVELVRDPLLELVMDLTPTELACLRRLRELTQAQREAMMQLLSIRPPIRRALDLPRRQRKTS